MNLLKVSSITLMLMLVTASGLAANDFDWTRSLSIEAQADLSGFKARLESRFKIGDLQIDAVLSNVDEPADAYLVLRLGEISKRPIDQVLEKYRRSKGKGWGEVAKSLGIKPGSSHFHTLKRGHDLNKGTSSRHGKVLSSNYATVKQEYLSENNRKDREKNRGKK